MILETIIQPHLTQFSEMGVGRNSLYIGMYIPGVIYLFSYFLLSIKNSQTEKNIEGASLSDFFKAFLHCHHKRKEVFLATA